MTGRCRTPGSGDIPLDIAQIAAAQIAVASTDPAEPRFEVVATGGDVDCLVMEYSSA